MNATNTIKKGPGRWIALAVVLVAAGGIAFGARYLLAGDKADAQAMVRDFVDAKGEWAKLRDVITERWLRAPKASFVYSIKKS